MRFLDILFLGNMDRMKHVEVFRVDNEATSIIERPQPRSGNHHPHPSMLLNFLQH